MREVTAINMLPFYIMRPELPRRYIGNEHVNPADLMEHWIRDGLWWYTQLKNWHC